MSVEAIQADRPMWCDDFDMDLPKVIPEARELLGDLADVRLLTHGHLTHGTLNHPTVWNHHDGTIAFFGLRGMSKPSTYWTDAPVVTCTTWEAFRDAWPHHYTMLVDGVAIWNTDRLWRHFEAIMWDVRGWRSDVRKATEAKQAVRRSIVRAVEELGRVVHSRKS